MQLINMKNDLQQRLDVLAALWESKDAQGIVRECYVDHTEITGAGTPELFTGKQALTELVSGLLQSSRSAQIRIDRCTALTPGTAYTWVTWDVTTDEQEVFNMKSLFVWQQFSEGWRIVADMYAEGVIPQ